MMVYLAKWPRRTPRSTFLPPSCRLVLASLTKKIILPVSWITEQLSQLNSKPVNLHDDAKLMFFFLCVVGYIVYCITSTFLLSRTFFLFLAFFSYNSGVCVILWETFAVYGGTGHDQVFPIGREHQISPADLNSTTGCLISYWVFWAGSDFRCWICWQVLEFLFHTIC